MAGAMHRMGVYLGLVEDDDYADDGEGYGDAYPGPHPQPRERADRSPARRDGYADARYSRETHHEAASRRSAVETLPPREYDEYDEYQSSGYEITALHPRTYNEARTIGEAFRANTPVIMNLTEMDDADAKRLVDFAAGLTFGLRGRIERVTAKVFLLTPHNVMVTAQDKQRIESGFFNQS
ncbi:MAG TPA: cell division protein SepF [Micromonosporaceae bacterium]|jgi:cell division inhibitor SepF